MMMQETTLMETETKYIHRWNVVRWHLIEEIKLLFLRNLSLHADEPQYQGYFFAYAAWLI